MKEVLILEITPRKPFPHLSLKLLLSYNTELTHWHVSHRLRDRWKLSRSLYEYGSQHCHYESTPSYIQLAWDAPRSS